VQRKANGDSELVRVEATLRALVCADDDAAADDLAGTSLDVAAVEISVEEVDYDAVRNGKTDTSHRLPAEIIAGSARRVGCRADIHRRQVRHIGFGPADSES